MKQRKPMIRFQHPEKLQALIDNLGLTREALEKRLRDFHRARKLDAAKEDPNLPRRTRFQSDSLSLKSVGRALKGKSILKSKAEVLRAELEARADEINPDLCPISWSDMGAIEGGDEEESDSACSKPVQQAEQGGKVSRRIIRQFGVAAAADLVHEIPAARIKRRTLDAELLRGVSGGESTLR